MCSALKADHLSELDTDTIKQIVHNLLLWDSYSLSLSNKSLRNKVGVIFEHRAKKLNSDVKKFHEKKDSSIPFDDKVEILHSCLKEIRDVQRYQNSFPIDTKGKEILERTYVKVYSALWVREYYVNQQ